ncbi:hypothetical protein LV779_11160 [Streptomyces thinghirensis]|nr:hypothetical protein [Streptomyces thinghirensis]
MQGVIAVPLPGERRPTDWERGTAGLARAQWITADMAYRTDVLKQVDGFDERFTRAFREDADLALRVLDAGWRIRRGRRTTRHPVRDASRWASLKQQRGNADDALMLRLHGPDWWAKAVAPKGPDPTPRGDHRRRRGRPRPRRRRPAPAPPRSPGSGGPRAPPSSPGPASLPARAPPRGHDHAGHQRAHPARRDLAPAERNVAAPPRPRLAGRWPHEPRQGRALRPRRHPRPRRPLQRRPRAGPAGGGSP